MGRRAAKSKDPNALTVAQRRILHAAVNEIWHLGYVTLHNSGPIRAGRRLVKLGYLIAHGAVWPTGERYEITTAGRKAIPR